MNDICLILYIWFGVWSKWNLGLIILYSTNKINMINHSTSIYSFSSIDTSVFIFSLLAWILILQYSSIHSLALILILQYSSIHSLASMLIAYTPVFIYSVSSFDTYTPVFIYSPLALILILQYSSIHLYHWYLILQYYYPLT